MADDGDVIPEREIVGGCSALNAAPPSRRLLRGTAGQRPALQDLIRVAVLTADRPDARLIFFEWVDVHHPVENYGMKSSPRGIAGFLGGDRSS